MVKAAWASRVVALQYIYLLPLWQAQEILSQIRNVETPAGFPGPRVTEVGDLPLWAGRWVTDAGDRVRAASFPIGKGAPSPYLDACGAGDTFYLHHRL